MKKKRVVITGLGTVNAVAADTLQFSYALRNGVCGIDAVTVFDTTDFRTRTGGEVKNFVPREVIPSDFSIKRMSRSDLMAFVAALEALKDAELFPFPDRLRMDTGVVVGGGAGGMLEAETVYRRYLADANRGVYYSNFSAFNCASSADHITSKLKLMGPKTTFMTACSSGATAIGYAGDLVRDGAADIIIAGGTEPLCRITYTAFNALQAVDGEYCKPFDKNRRGLSLGEGAGMLILEELGHALNRGVRIYGELLGYGVSADSYHMTAPEPQGAGAVRCMRAALSDSGVSIDQVDYINAHGTATPANDVMETRAIKAVFGKRAYRIPVSSTKSMTGHTLGAAGAIEAVAGILGIYQGFIPPTIHLIEPDPECDLDYVSEGSRDADLNIVLSNSFAFGGNNTVLALGKYTAKGIIHE